MEIAGFRSKYSDEQIEALLDAAANGGGGGESGGSQIQYFLKKDIDAAGFQVPMYFSMMASILRYTKDGSHLIIPFGMTNMKDQLGYGEVDADALGIDLGLNIMMNNTIVDVMGVITDPNTGITKEQIDAIPRITKEEFYSIN